MGFWRDAGIYPKGDWGKKFFFKVLEWRKRARLSLLEFKV